MSKLITRFIKDESGATAIEYGLIAAGIAGVVITTVNLLGETVEGVFATVEGQM